MAVPKAGDLLIRGSAESGFDVLDAGSHQHVTTRPTFPETLTFAARHTKGTVWHQTTDNRGRPMGDPVVVLPKPGE